MAGCGYNFPLKKGHFLTNGSKRWQFFVLINARPNGHIFRAKKSHISSWCVFLKHSVHVIIVMILQSCTILTTKDQTPCLSLPRSQEGRQGCMSGKVYKIKQELLCSKKRRMRTFQIYSEIISYFFNGRVRKKLWKIPYRVLPPPPLPPCYGIFFIFNCKYAVLKILC